ncbi:MAG TPA: hypothetical protein VEJ84_11005, partial [Acidimicrobiales bacterium]|nr:hypothetical protein [Acidimicrobiales bacterium]
LQHLRPGPLRVRPRPAHRAASLHGISQGLFAQLGHVLSPTEAGPAERDWSRLRDELGPDTFEEAFASGRQLAASWWQADRQARAVAIFALEPLALLFEA